MRFAKGNKPSTMRNVSVKTFADYEREKDEYSGVVYHSVYCKT